MGAGVSFLTRVFIASRRGGGEGRRRAVARRTSHAAHCERVHTYGRVPVLAASRRCLRSRLGLFACNDARQKTSSEQCNDDLRTTHGVKSCSVHSWSAQIFLFTPSRSAQHMFTIGALMSPIASKNNGQLNATGKIFVSASSLHSGACTASAMKT